MSEPNVITQVPTPGFEDRGELSAVAELPETIVLNMRGQQFEIKRQRLLALPESILFGLSSGMAASPFDESSDDPDSEVMIVDFSPACFRYILSSLTSQDEGITPIPINKFKVDRGINVKQTDYSEYSDESLGAGQEDNLGDNESNESLPWLQKSANDVPDVLKMRPTMIVLREDLEYYVLGDPGLSVEQELSIKERIGQNLTNGPSEQFIFNGLRNCQTLDTPEYHLMQMLVLAGLDARQKWDYRERTDNTSRILSLQMSPVQLPDSSELLESVYALQKLLLFWRKPAKKCWWDKFDMSLARIGESDGNVSEKVRVHARRVWTLELSILGLEE